MENTQTDPKDPNAKPAAAVPPKEEHTDPKEELIPYSQFKSVKDDMHKYKEEARKNADALKATQEKEMRDKEQWKEFGQAKEKEATDWKTKYEALNSSNFERAKISAVREAALKLGLVDSAIDDLEMLDLKDVVVETTSTGRTQVIGAKSAAERIKSIRPHWFDNKRVPSVNGRMPEVESGKDGQVSYADVVKLEAEAKKTGDYTKYKEAVMKLKTKK